MNFYSSEMEKRSRMLIVSVAWRRKASCIPTIAFSLMRCKLPFYWRSWCSRISVQRPSSAKPAMTKCLIWLNCGLHETRNISRVIPLVNIYLPVMPLLQRARKIQLTLVWIWASPITPSELNKSMIPLSIRILIDCLDRAKWTNASVENYLTYRSPC